MARPGCGLFGEVAGWRARPYVGSMNRQASSVRAFALSALVFGLAGLAFLASTWVLNPYPAGANCETADGYAAMRTHAEANGVLALLGLASTAVAASVSLAGAVKAKAHRIWFVLGVVPLVGIGLTAVLLLLVSGLYCQN
jgi:hypothetical protein